MPGTTIKQDHHASAVIAVEDYEDVPVLIHHVGRYPSFVDDMDRIKVAIYGWHSHDGRQGYNHAQVTVIKGHRSLEVNRWERSPPDRPLEQLIEEARALFPAAKQTLETLDEQYAAADRLYDRLRALPIPMTREAYEAACADFGCEPRADEALTTWGVFSFPEYGLDVLPRLLIDQRRAGEVEDEKERERRSQEQSHQEVMDELASRPVKQTYTILVPKGADREQAWIENGELHTVVRRTLSQVIDDDMVPFGQQFLRYEGRRGDVLVIEVRG